MVPDDLLQSIAIGRRANENIVLEIALAATVAFLLGLGFSQLGPDMRRSARSVSRSLRVLRALNLLGTLALLLLVTNTVRVNGLDSAKQWISGQVRMANIEGVTTFTHAATAAAILAAALLMRCGQAHPAIRRLLKLELVWAFSACCARAIVNGERLAILIPFVGCFAAFCLIRNFRLRAVHMAIPVLAAALLFAVFAGSEAFRSFKVKNERGTIEDNLFAYSYERLLLYYAVSVNAGAHEYTLKKEGISTVPLFSSTTGPFARVLYASPLGDWLIREWDQPLYDYTEEEGARAKEFTNRWGVSRPFVESWPTGFMFWLMWGWLSGRVFRAACGPGLSIYSVAVCGVMSAGLLDIGRVLNLGEVHIILPILLLTAGAWWCSPPRPLASDSPRRPRMVPIESDGR